MERIQKWDTLQPIPIRWASFLAAFIPLAFTFVFATLVIRAREAFGTWPRMSADDPWSLVNRAPNDYLSTWFSYSAHINVTYLLLFMTLICTPIVLILLLMPRKRKHFSRTQLFCSILGIFGSIWFLIFEGGRFLFWFLD